QADGDPYAQADHPDGNQSQDNPYQSRSPEELENPSQPAITPKTTAKSEIIRFMRAEPKSMQIATPIAWILNMIGILDSVD
ncbi:MAG: hypothetical protein RSC06_04215, partial [Clostridia bacterium]